MSARRRSQEDGPDPLTAEVDELFACLVSGDAADPVAAGARLATLIDRRDAQESSELCRLETAAQDLAAASRAVRSSTTIEEALALVCSVTSALSGVDVVRFERLGRGMSAEVGPSTFRLDVDGQPAGVVRAEGAVDVDAAHAIRTFIDEVGAALEIEGLCQRSRRQRDLSEAMPREEVLRLSSTAPAEVPPPIFEAVRPEGLTDREHDVFGWLLTGASNAAIARELGIGLETVRTHVRHVLRKCMVTNRVQLVAGFGSQGRDPASF